MRSRCQEASAFFARLALVLIDLQNDYFPGGKWTLFNIEEAANNAAQLIEKFRSNGDLVVHIRHEFTTNNAPFFLPASEGAKIHTSVQPKSGEPVVLKHYINSFRETDLKNILDQHSIEQLVICGAMSHMCIDAVVRAAADLGYKVTVLHDACATRDQEFNGQVIPAAQVHGAYMASLAFGYAGVVSADEYLQAQAAAA